MGVSTTWRVDCGRWQVTVRRRGEKKTKLAPKGMGQREAVAVIGDELIEQIEAAQTPTPDAAQPPTLWDFCIGVYADRHELSDRTWRQRKYKVAGIMEDLGNLRLDQVTTPIVTDWIDLLQADGAPLKKGGRGQPLEEGGAALNDYVVALKAIFRVAVENHYLDEVPFRKKLASIDLATDREAWTPTMKARLVDVAGEHDVGMRHLAEFLMLTGCRPVEAIRLRWAHVQDVPAPTLTITGKGLRFRKLPLGGPLAVLFRSLPRIGPAVFPVEGGKSAGECYRFWPQKRWERVCSVADVPSVAYDLRHTFITEMVAKGTDLPMIAKWAGNSVRVIEERYSHLSAEHLKAVAKNVTPVVSTTGSASGEAHDAETAAGGDDQ